MDTLIRSSDFLSAELDGEVCLFHPGRGEYINLNATSSAIWRFLDTPKNALEIEEYLTKIFDVDPDRCGREMRSFLALALKHGLLLGLESKP